MKFLTVLLALYFCISAFAQNKDRALLVVNGGIDETQNYASFTRDLNLFLKNIPNKDAIALNANATSETIDDLLVFSLLGIPRTRSNNSPNAREATRSNIWTSSWELASKNPADFVSVWVDHGSPKGQSLWGREDFSGSDLAALMDKFPESTLKRNIILSCHGAYSLVDDNIKPVPLYGNFQDFVNRKYPPNRCGLSTSDYDMLSWNSDSGTFWNAFNKKPQISLAELKLEIEKDPGKMTPNLTSDLFLSDLFTQICSDKNEGESLCLNCLVGLGNRIPRNGINLLQSDLYKEACEDSLNKKTADAYNEAFALQDIGGYLGDLPQFCEKEFLRSRLPEQSARFDRLMIQIASLRKELLTGSAQQKEQAKIKLTELELHAGEAIVALERAITENVEEFKSFSEHECGDLLKTNIFSVYNWQPESTSNSLNLSPGMRNCLNNTKTVWGYRPQFITDLSEKIAANSSLALGCYKKFSKSAPTAKEWMDLADQLKNRRLFENAVKTAVSEFVILNSTRERMLRTFVQNNSQFQYLIDRLNNIKQCEAQPLN